MTAAIVPLPWLRPPLSLNDRGVNPHVKNSAIQQALTEARWAIRAANLTPVVGADVVLHWQIATRHRRDSDNLAATTKVCQDALVQEGILPDDSWVHVPHSGQTIHAPNGERARMWIELTPPDGEEFAEWRPGA